MNNPNSDMKNVRQDAKDAADTMRQGAGQAASEAATHARRAAADISDTAELTLEQLKEQLETLKADFTKLASSAREAGYEYVGGHLEEAKRNTQEFTRDRPFAALGIAAGAGFVLAHLLARR